MSEDDDLLAEQVSYYRERAGEYEDWWFRRGRYHHGLDANAAWFAEAAEVQADLERFEPAGHVLELACGTGLWTRQLAAHAARVTAVDASPEALDIARAKVPATNVDYVEADLFAWEPERTYDVCFFSFWLSHVPNERMRSFWEKVAWALAPGGRVYLIDNARSHRASARDHTLQDPDEQVMVRRLADGREYHIVKHWFQADALQRQLAQLGRDAQIHATCEFFVYGHATPAAHKL
jgi:demethylmenaquinone methyltransferase/2-methoxy-6-polyprenyl-1,4-benzoquinol methylase